MDLIQRGNNFIFEAQLFNGREDRFVKVELIDTSNGNTIGVYSINHLNGGLYEKKDVVANSSGVYLARYTTYKDNLLTKRDTKYAIKTEKIRVEAIIEELTEVIDFGDGSTV